MKIFIQWFLSALAIAIAAYILPGITITGIIPLLVLAVVIAAINTFIRPLILLFTLPLTVMTLGLFALVVNTLLIMLAGAIVPGVDIDGFFSALLFGIVVALVTAVLKKFDGNPNN